MKTKWIVFVVILGLIGGVINGLTGLCIGGLIGFAIWGAVWVYKDTHPKSILWRL